MERLHLLTAALAAIIVLLPLAAPRQRPQPRVTLMPPYRAGGAVALRDVYGVSKYTGAGVRVAVVDTGIDYTHPDLSEAVEALASFVVSSDGGGPLVWIVGINGTLSAAREFDEYVKLRVGCYAWLDENGHGTHVAGIIAGSGKLSAGRYAGLAPGAKLWVVKVLDAQGTGSVAALVKALRWLADKPVDVVNLALGLTAPPPEELREAVELLASRGKVVVAAAGNSGTIGAVEYPARYPSVVAVAAVDARGERAPFSAMGLPSDWKPDFAALGVNVVSTLPTYQCTLGRGPYAALSGTSMATAVASGIVALWLEAVGPQARDKVFLAASASIPASPLAYKTLVLGYGVLLPP
ncbi:MAG: S8 family serine peptidase [Desulfurococcaceae archaeon]